MTEDQGVEDQNFQERIAGIETLIRKLDLTSDPAVRAAVKELMQSVMDLHGAAVNRMMEIVDEDSHGAAIIDALGKDPLSASLLILYGLHPEDTPTRVARAVEKAGVNFRRQGAGLHLEQIENGVVRLRVSGTVSASAGKALKSAIEEQIYALAPDVTRIEGLSNLGATDFVGIENLVGAAKGGD